MAIHGQEDRPPTRLHPCVADVQTTWQHCAVCWSPVDGSHRTAQRTFAGTDSHTYDPTYRNAKTQQRISSRSTSTSQAIIITESAYTACKFNV